MTLLKEFKAFAMRGNVMDMAVGILIGGAFGKIVTSMVNDILMPPIGKLTGNVNFADLFVALDGQTYSSLAEAKAAGAATINYGQFVNTIVDFVIVALAIFLVVRAMNALRRQEAQAPAAPPAPPPPPPEVTLLTEIRDLLKQGR